ncbi:MAG: neutral/alkaline non-lysosomal ceramidase N-terminal domain-containing protein [Bryobacterales bacterium]|nr:neutral/alkaline non-lysosomal ceramidase N-terminal domain-containing protein [Bryobacterales bacterium]
MTHRILTAICLLALVPGGLSAQRIFRAGAATSNITPPVGAPTVGGWTPQPSKYIHDELHVRCLVLDDGQTRLALSVSDNLGIPRYVYDEAKRALQQKTGLPMTHILMSSTHTHSGPSSRANGHITGGGEPLDEYQRFLAVKLADCVQNAIHNLEPARVGWGAGSEPGQVFNRRWKLKPGKHAVNPFGGIDTAVMNPGGNPDIHEPAGPVDPEVAFLSVQSASGRPIALLANYSLHYVGGVGPNHISADYFGMFAGRIRQMLGADGQDPPFVGILSNGTSGDVNNNDYSPNRKTPSRRYEPYEKMRMIANIVAAEVYRVYQTTPHHDWVPLRMLEREIPMGVRVPTAEQVAWAKEVLARPAGAAAKHQREENYAHRIMRMSTWPAEIPYIVQALRIGDLAIVGLPNEVFAETGLEIKKRSPFPRTFTISLANGGYIYLPTPEQHKLGGYETWIGSSLFEVEATTKIMKTLVEMFDGLKR